MRAKVNSFIDRLTNGQKSIDRFQDIALAGRSFRQAYESNAFTISQIMDFVESKETQRFKRWISDAKPNADLLREYDRSNAADSAFIKSLPVRMARFVMFSSAGALLGNTLGGAGAAGALTGLAIDWTVSKAEEMLFEQIKLGWRPNQWIAEAARPLLSTKDNEGAKL